MINIKDKVSISSYGNYSSGNYGINCLKVEIGSLILYFSYSTIIAFRNKGNLIISKNYWSTTTRKHLNWINTDKKIRIKRDIFNEKLENKLKEHNLI